MRCGRIQSRHAVEPADAGLLRQVGRTRVIPRDVRRQAPSRQGSCETAATQQRGGLFQQIDEVTNAVGGDVRQPSRAKLVQAFVGQHETDSYANGVNIRAWNPAWPNFVLADPKSSPLEGQQTKAS